MFPKAINDHEQSHLLLLVNVSEQYLSIEQLALRRQYQHQQQTTNQSLLHILNKENGLISSAIRSYFDMNYQFLMDQFHINWNILDYNYTRLNNLLF